MRRTTSMPWRTSPKTTLRKSHHGAGWVVTKNWAAQGARRAPKRGDGRHRAGAWGERRRRRRRGATGRGGEGEKREAGEKRGEEGVRKEDQGRKSRSVGRGSEWYVTGAGTERRRLDRAGQSARKGLDGPGTSLYVDRGWPWRASPGGRGGT